MVAGIGVLLAQVGIAVAADMPGTLPPPPEDYPVPVLHLPQFFFPNTGWYLRADLGSNAGRVDGAEVGPGAVSTTDSHLGNNYMAGIGAGVKSHWLRTDVTLDYSWPMDFQGTTFTTDDVSAKVSAFSALFNGYLDLGTWYGVTPYVGAGAGTAYLRASDYRSTVAPTVTGGEHTQWNLAWAVMGGVGVNLASNLMMDVGYRYIDFGDLLTADDTAAGATLIKNIAAHEVRIGVRWSFDDLREDP